MARETIHLMQGFTAGRGQKLKADQPVVCRTAEDARRKAERMAELRVGVVAFSTSADPELGDYDEEPVVHFRAGRLPPPFSEEAF